MKVFLPIFNITQSLVLQASSDIPDGAVATSGFREAPINDIGTLQQVQDALLRPLKGFHNKFHMVDDIKDEQGLRTHAQVLEFECLCGNLDCTTLIAANLFGVHDVDEGEFRSRTPLIFFGKDEKPLPCGAILQVDYSDISVQGCTLVEAFNTTAPGGEIQVTGCVNGTVESFALIESKGKIIARAMSGWEMIPDNIDPSSISPDKKMKDYFKTSSINIDPVQIDEEIFFQLATFLGPINIQVPVSFEIELNEIIQQSQGLITNILDNIGQFYLPSDFHPNHTASEATITDILRVLHTFSILRLTSSTQPFNNSNPMKPWDTSNLYRDTTTTDVPETSSIPDVLTGIVLVCLTALAVGASSEQLYYALKESTTSRNIRAALWVSGATFLTLLLFFACELTSFSLKWKEELERDRYRSSIILTTVVGASSTGGIFPLRVGQDFNPRMVQVVLITVSDSSYGRIGWFVGTAVLISLSLFLGFMYARIIQRHYAEENNEDLEEENEEQPMTVKLSEEEATEPE